MRICHGTRCELCLPASPSGPIDARGDQRRVLVAPAHRPQQWSRRRIRWPAARFTAWVRGSARRTRRPRVADLAAESAVAGILDRQDRVDGLAQPRRGLAEPDEAQPAGAGGQGHVHRHSERQKGEQRDERRCRPG